MSNIKEIESMTVYEFNVRMLSYRLSELDKQQDLHLQAWLNQMVQATKGSGKNVKPYYRSFKEFFDFETYQNEILDEKNEVQLTDQNELKDLLMQANK
ncbi:hypothetical protein [Vagococcus silagei]|uniref:Phage protein n=2 Tax=Vagococcus silagei TaxID=2508885 RepID=A0A4S3B8K1_9ENTE|nr:hypothetical protein ESZ54_01145 [Vagococcus silagei]